MTPARPPAQVDPLRQQARRLQWGLMLYLLVLVVIGIGVLRLALTARRFDRVTVVPTETQAAEADTGVDDSANGGVIPVSGEVP